MGLFDFLRAGNPADSIDVRTLKARLDGGDVVLIDVRSAGEYAMGHVAQAKLVPLDTLAARAGELPKDQPIHVICQSGGRSARATDQLAGLGFKAINVAGGTSAWIAAGLPVAR